jgi:hypothetical protein
MAPCPHCATDIEDGCDSCPRCAPGDPRAVEAPSGLPPASSGTSEAAPSRASAGARSLLGVVAAGVIGAFVTLLVLGHPAVPGDTPPPVVAEPSVHEPTTTVEPPAAPKWTSANQQKWVSSHRRSVAFELPAERRVAVWMEHVRPLLVVRCLAGSVDTFVVTETAAAIEPQDGDHTVHLAFDGGPADTERWPDSVHHDALFAPEGRAFAERLASARTLRFGFTPHNAPPVTAEFALAGADQVLASVARACASPRR